MSHRPIFRIINVNTGEGITSKTVNVRVSESIDTGSSINCSRLGTSAHYRADSGLDHEKEYILTVDHTQSAFITHRLTPTASLLHVFLNFRQLPLIPK